MLFGAVAGLRLRASAWLRPLCCCLLLWDSRAGLMVIALGPLWLKCNFYSTSSRKQCFGLKGTGFSFSRKPAEATKLHSQYLSATLQVCRRGSGAGYVPRACEKPVLTSWNNFDLRSLLSRTSSIRFVPKLLESRRHTHHYIRMRLPATRPNCRAFRSYNNRWMKLPRRPKVFLLLRRSRS